MIRVPNRFNSLFITRNFFPDFYEDKNLEGINSGYCYDWAYYAYRLFPNVSLWSTDYHAWVQVGLPNPRTNQLNHRFFDSETFRGVKNFMRLGCNMRFAPEPWDDQDPVEMDVEDFKRFWNNIGAGNRRHWNTLLERNLKRVLGKRYSELTPILGRDEQQNKVGEVQAGT